MNIALCTDIFIPHMGGIETAIDTLANEYICLGHNVAVFTSDMALKNIDDSSLKYNVYRTHSHKVFFGIHTPFPKKDEKFNKCLENFAPDVIHAHTPFAIGEWSINKAKKLRIPSVLTTHTYLNYMNDTQVPFSRNNPLHKSIVKRLSLTPARVSASSDILTSVSESVIKNEIRDVYHLDREVVVVRNGYNAKRDHSSGGETPYVLDAKQIILSYAGQIDKTKNIEFSLYVCSELKKRNIPFEFNLAGSVNGKIHLPFTKNDKEKLIRLSKQLGIDENVHFRGRLSGDALRKHYRESDLFLFPSIYDTDGIVVKEAAGEGTPALVVKNTGASEQIEDGINGYALNDNVNDFAAKIEEIFELKKNDPTSYLKLRKSTANKRMPTWREIAEQYVKLYEQGK